MNPSPEVFEVAALRKQSVKSIVPLLENMSDEAVAALRAAEELDVNPRESLLHAVSAVQTERAAAVVTASAQPAWLEPDYLGPLTTDQAQARLTAHGHHITKPVASVMQK